MINRVILMGRLVADPELKTTNTGISVTSFRIAVDRNYVKAGEQRQADFFDIVAWRSSAEFVCRNFSKGSLIAVDGQLQSRQYQTKDGQNRTAIEVVSDNISFTGERRDSSEPTYGDPVPAVSQPSRQMVSRQQTLGETQYRQSSQREFPGGGGMPSDGGYYTPDDDLPWT
jgi:single-strand DNA-binding protein